MVPNHSTHRGLETCARHRPDARHVQTWDIGDILISGDNPIVLNRKVKSALIDE